MLECLNEVSELVNCFNIIINFFSSNVHFLLEGGKFLESLIVADCLEINSKLSRNIKSVFIVCAMDCSPSEGEDEFIEPSKLVVTLFCNWSLFSDVSPLSNLVSFGLIEKPDAHHGI